MLLSNLGTTVGKIFLADVAVAVAVCTLAIQTAAMRMMFSMARDGNLPYATSLRKINPRTGTPILPGIVVGVLTIALLVVNLGDASVFLALSSVCIVMLYGAYLMVTGPMLVRAPARAVPRRPRRVSSPWGGSGSPSTRSPSSTAPLMMINLAWPRAEVYDVAGGHWYLQ